MPSTTKKFIPPIEGQRGQSFEAFRVLIAMVIALAVLVIILGVISYFDSLRQKVSYDTLYSSWKSAVDSPNNEVVRVPGLFFTKGTRFSKTQFSRQVSLDNECIVFDADTSLGYSFDGDALEVTSSILGAIYMQCNVNNTVGASSGSGGCFAYCLISFGKAIAGPNAGTT